MNKYTCDVCHTSAEWDDNPGEFYTCSRCFTVGSFWFNEEKQQKEPPLPPESEEDCIVCGTHELMAMENGVWQVVCDCVEDSTSKELAIIHFRERNEKLNTWFKERINNLIGRES